MRAVRVSRSPFLSQYLHTKNEDMSARKERSSSNGSPGTTSTPPPASGLQTEEGTTEIGESMWEEPQHKGKGGKSGGGGIGGDGGGRSGGGGGGRSGGSSGSGGGSGCFSGGGGGSDGGGGGSGGSSGSGGGGSGGGRGGAVQRGGFGGGQRQQQQRRSKTPMPQQLREWFAQRGASRGDAWRAKFGDEAERPRWAELLRSGVDIFALDYDAILGAMYALSVSAEGDCYLRVPPDPGIEAAALGASEFAFPGSAPAEALHTFPLDSGASRCFFRDSTTLIPLLAPVPIRLADPSGGAVFARSSTVLPCPAVPSGSLSSFHLPSFSTSLVSTAALQDVMVTTTTRGGQCVSICTCTRTGRHLATFTHRPGPSQYTLTTERGIRTGLCLPSRPRLTRPAFLASRGSNAPFLTPPRFPRRLLPCRLSTWTFPLQLRERFREDLPVLRLHSDRGGEFSSDLLWEFCRGEGILQSFTLLASLQQNGVAERHIGLVMEMARTSMVHAAAPHFLWPFAVRYAVHQLNLWPRVSLPETSPTLRWMRKVGDASVFRVSGVFYPSSAYLVPPCSVEVLIRLHRESLGQNNVPPVFPLADLLREGCCFKASAEPGGAEPKGAEPGGVEYEGAESGGA
ncbi:unnamed protein product [Closterium sp. NIES-54]